MKPSRLILFVVMFLSFSNPAEACIISIGDGAFYSKGLTIIQPLDLSNDYRSPARLALHANSPLLGSGIGQLPHAALGDALYKGSFLNNLNAAGLVHTGSYWLEQRVGEQNYPAPVPEPSTMLLLGIGIVMSVRYMKKLRYLP